VQSRTRRVERWENDLDRLDSILHHRLPRAMDSYRRAALSEQTLEEMVEALRTEDRLNEQRAQETMRDARAARSSAYEVLDELLDEISLLIVRLRRVNPDAPTWLLVENRDTLLQARVYQMTWAATASEAERAELAEENVAQEEPFDLVWSNAQRALAGLLQKLQPVFDSQRAPDPPRRSGPRWLSPLGSVRRRRSGRASRS
jgi:hypothetical protein